ncbi:hypothetical protein A0H76_1941 [Hepatospora eriocheir]|uniref:Uncharacterized protein n=1 Tax=Hepatospora eriocheir TaxID=1081669 RepID=A0A1X0QG72_9MICR|nr:hypothetical protein A0H76_1941 [Hepatospora eriocheir]
MAMSFSLLLKETILFLNLFKNSLFDILISGKLLEINSKYCFTSLPSHTTPTNLPFLFDKHFSLFL